MVGLLPQGLLLFLVVLLLALLRKLMDSVSLLTQGATFLRLPLLLLPPVDVKRPCAAWRAYIVALRLLLPLLPPVDAKRLHLG